MILCINCNKIKNELDFYFRKSGKIIKPCKDCKRKYQKNYYNNNKQNIESYRKDYYCNNKSQLIYNQKLRSQKRKSQIAEYQKKYRKINKDKFKIYKNKARNKLSIKLKILVSNAIYQVLRKNKNNFSCFKYLNYSAKDLKNHLEKQFEPWMNWKNHGIYDPKTWDDNNHLTWTWNIDHIIPQSDLPYESMDCDNFKRCWDLSNLRPYSSKQNILDGSNRVRHSKEIK